MPWATPYSYAANNPVAMVDVDGLAPEGGGNEGAPKSAGEYEGQEGARSFHKRTETRTTSHFGYPETVEVTHVVRWIWHAGTEENCFDDARWMPKEDYNNFIYERVASLSSPNENYARMPFLYERAVYDAPEFTELGLKSGTKGFAFLEAYERIRSYLEDSPGRSQGIEDRSIDIFFAIEGGLVLRSLVKNGLKQAGSRLGSETENFSSGLKVGANEVASDPNWKSKIIGTAQKTQTEGHRFRSYREAIQMAKDPNCEKVFLNKGINRIADLPPKTIVPNVRPDVAGVYKNYVLALKEVPSKSDIPANLIMRNTNALQKLPWYQTGNLIYTNKIENIT